MSAKLGYPCNGGGGIADHSGLVPVLANLVKITLWNVRNTPGTATLEGEKELPQFWLTPGHGGGGLRARYYSVQSEYLGRLK